VTALHAANPVPALLSLEIPGYEGRNVLLIAFLVIALLTIIVVWSIRRMGLAK